MPDAKESLYRRRGLPDEFAYLEATCPRRAWREKRLHASAVFWLERHAGFRDVQRRLAAAGNVLNRDGDASAYAGAVLPMLARFLPDLEEHHELESGWYFPAMTVLEPRMRRGFELLDRDHDAIHRILDVMAAAASDLARVQRTGEAVRLAASIRNGRKPLFRHLDDEEDIVVPLLTLRGDPYDLADQPARG